MQNKTIGRRRWSSPQQCYPRCLRTFQLNLSLIYNHAEPKIITKHLCLRVRAGLSLLKWSWRSKLKTNNGPVESLWVSHENVCPGYRENKGSRNHHSNWTVYIACGENLWPAGRFWDLRRGTVWESEVGLLQSDKRPGTKFQEAIDLLQIVLPWCNLKENAAFFVASRDSRQASPRCHYNTIQYNTKFVKRHVAVALEAPFVSKSD